MNGQPFSLLKLRGKGHLAGVILQAQGMEGGSTLFFEGDEEVTIDGVDTVHGTGSEDMFNGGWYDVPGRWDRRRSFALSGSLDYKKHLGRTGGYRFFLLDGYPFQQQIDFSIEHGPSANSIPTDYAATTFFYAATPPAEDLAAPAASLRRVSDPSRIVLHPGWTVPIESFSFQGATLSKTLEKVGDQTLAVLVLSADAAKKDLFDDHGLALTCDLPAAGRYRVWTEWFRGPQHGIVQVSTTAGKLGAPIDLYADQRTRSGRIQVGEASFEQGNQSLFLRLTGRNQNAQEMRLEILSIEFERIQ